MCVCVCVYCMVLVYGMQYGATVTRGRGTVRGGQSPDEKFTANIPANKLVKWKQSLQRFPVSSKLSNSEQTQMEFIFLFLSLPPSLSLSLCLSVCFPSTFLSLILSVCFPVSLFPTIDLSLFPNSFGSRSRSQCHEFPVGGTNYISLIHCKANTEVSHPRRASPCPLMPFHT